MWTVEQQQRLLLEHRILQQEGFSQFSVYKHAATDTYSASGTTSSNSGRKYTLSIPIPNGFPFQRPRMYLTDPLPIYTAGGTRVSSLGVSHEMHTLTPHANGAVQICHWRDNRWHSNILLQKVFLKGIIWIEAYEQHLATGLPLANFVRTMAETI